MKDPIAPESLLDADDRNTSVGRKIVGDRNKMRACRRLLACAGNTRLRIGNDSVLPVHDACLHQRRQSQNHRSRIASGIRHHGRSRNLFAIQLRQAIDCLFRKLSRGREASSLKPYTARCAASPQTPGAVKSITRIPVSPLPAPASATLHAASPKIVTAHPVPLACPRKAAGADSSHSPKAREKIGEIMRTVLSLCRLSRRGSTWGCRSRIRVNSRAGITGRSHDRCL